jgi:hypothetical protein
MQDEAQEPAQAGRAPRSQQPQQRPADAPAVGVGLLVLPDGTIQLTLTPKVAANAREDVSAQPALRGAAVKAAAAPASGSSSSDAEDEMLEVNDDDGSSEGGEPMDYDEMRAMITRAYETVDAEEEDDEEGAGGGKGDKAGSGGRRNTVKEELVCAFVLKSENRVCDQDNRSLCKGDDDWQWSRRSWLGCT